MITFQLNEETLIFKEIPSEYGGDSIAFGLYREDGKFLGGTSCQTDKFQERAWYIIDIWTFLEFQRQGYGSALLEKTCEALWQRENMIIILERPGNSIAPDGFDRKAWYERHGFIPHPKPENTWMWREPPN